MTILFTRDVYEDVVIEGGSPDKVLIKQGAIGDEFFEDEVCLIEVSRQKPQVYPDDSCLYVNELDMDEWIGLYSDLAAYVRALKDELAAATERQLKLSEFVKTEIIDKSLSIQPSRSMYLTTEDAVRALQLYNLAQKAKDL